MMKKFALAAGLLIALIASPLLRAEILEQVLVKVVHEWPGAILVPPVSLKLELDASAEEPRTSTPVGRAFTARPAPRKGTLHKETSWWTARATTGQVTSGFTKEEILRKPRQDPRAQGGMFARLEALLAALAGPR